MVRYNLVSKCFKGFEDVLEKELQELGVNDIEKQTRAVSFSCDAEKLVKANYSLRSALSIIWILDEFKLKEQDDLYKKALKINWHEFIPINKTFRVETSVFSKHFNHSGYAGLKLKDAVVDQIRKVKGGRPDVNTDRPDIIIHLSIQENEVRIGFNCSGDPLFKRGYRQKTADAPINEVLAASLILASGWDKKSPLHNPMCGSGTLAIEAGLMYCNKAPNLNRKRFAFENLIANAEEIKSKVKSDLMASEITHEEFGIFCSDNDSDMVYASKINISNAGLSEVVQCRNKDFFTSKKKVKNAKVFINPPYDERLSIDNPIVFYSELGTRLKHLYPGCEHHIISSYPEFLKEIGLKPSTKTETTNGGLSATYAVFETFTGDLKEHKTLKNNR